MALPSLFQQLEQLVAIPSVSSHNPDWDMGNRPVVEQLAEWLENLGFQCDIQTIDAANPNKCNLIATLGSGPGGLVLSGHTDTVPYDNVQWRSDPFKLTEDGQRWYGLGATDMKGFFPVAIAAAAAFADQPLQQPLIILATADEESSMCGAQALVDAGRPKARYAVVGEPTGLRPIRMHKGIMMEEVRIEGRSGHSSDPSLGNSALEAMHEVMSSLMTLRRELQQRYQYPGFSIPGPTLNLGCIHGGDNPNRICGQCSLQFDLRPVPGMNNEALRAEIDKHLKQIADQRQCLITRHTLFGGVPAFSEPETSRLVQACEQLTGHKAESVAFATEAPFLQKLGMETIIMGPGSIDQAHQPNEFIPLEQIQPAIDTLKSLIAKFCL